MNYEIYLFTWKIDEGKKLELSGLIIIELEVPV